MAVTQVSLMYPDIRPPPHLEDEETNEVSNSAERFHRERARCGFTLSSASSRLICSGAAPAAPAAEPGTGNTKERTTQAFRGLAQAAGPESSHPAGGRGDQEPPGQRSRWATAGLCPSGAGVSRADPLRVLPGGLLGAGLRPHLWEWLTLRLSLRLLPGARPR